MVNLSVSEDEGVWFPAYLAFEANLEGCDRIRCNAVPRVGENISTKAGESIVTGITHKLSDEGDFLVPIIHVKSLKA